MINSFQSYLKFLVKVRITGGLRAFFLFVSDPFFRSPKNPSNLLIINLQGLGDLVVFTGVLKHYKNAFPGREIYLLAKEENGLQEIFKNHFVDEVVSLNYRQLAVNPFYGYRLVKRLRKIGFGAVINHDFSAAEILGKMLSLEVGAKEVVGYEGMALEFIRPFDKHQKINLKFFSKKILPRFTKVIPRIDYRADLLDRLPSALEHYVSIFENLSEFKSQDYSTFLPSSYPNKISVKNYIVLNLNASVAYKRWPLDRFALVAQKTVQGSRGVVLIGSPKEKVLSSDFKKIFSGDVIDLVGQTSLQELIAVIRDSSLVVSCDTSVIHIAVALKKPTLCPAGGGQFGMFTDYGYPSTNHWVYERKACFCDNWHCGRDLKQAGPSPCLDAVSAESVTRKLGQIIESTKNSPTLSHTDFKVSFNPVLEKKPAKTKIIFSGVQFENYNFNRLSFEYSNFLSTLKQMPDIDVVFYPFDFILQMGRRAFNHELLKLVKREKPDLFFAFMYTDELEVKTLEKIKNLTKSIAWFADDHWRLDSYSRFFAPHFTKAITTWGEGLKNYARYGVKNIIRSQWACNHLVWKPSPVENQDIDVSFVGQHNSAREEIVRQLRHLGVDIWVRGWGWPEGRLPGGDMINAFSRSKINLNFNTPPNRWDPKLLARLFFKRSLNKIRPNWHLVSNFRCWLNTAIPQIKARPFEVVGCKAFLISAFADDVDHYYEDKKEIAYYKDIPDLAEKIQFYLKHPELRTRIAEAGYERTIQEHTYVKRFTEIFQAIGLKYDA
ncbi:MAG: glycosyltransferase [Patescibacteria group bacterium]